MLAKPSDHHTSTSHTQVENQQRVSWQSDLECHREDHIHAPWPGTWKLCVGVVNRDAPKFADWLFESASCSERLEKLKPRRQHHPTVDGRHPSAARPVWTLLSFG